MKKEELKEEVGKLDLVNTEFEADGLCYMDGGVSLTQVYDLIDQLDEPKKVVVPKLMADHIELCKSKNKRLNVALSESPEAEMAFEMGVNLEEVNEIYARAWLDGYEVEKEQLYYVLDKQGRTLLMLMGGEVCTSGGYALSESTFTKDIYQLTEKQIKDYDQRFWSFKEEVAE